MLKKLLGVVLGASLLASPVQARLTGAPGAYLASQTAMKSRDYDAAARYLARALAFDGGNAKLLENAVHANVALGDLETALPHAQSLSLLNTSGQLADLVVLVDLVGRGEYHAALGKLRSEQSRVSPLMRGLMIGWMHEALGAIAQFARYHHGLVLARRGDLKGAQEQLESGAVVPIRAARNSVEIYARILAAQGLREQAIQVISEELATGRSNVQLTELRNRLALGEPVTFSGIVTPQDAVADILQSFPRFWKSRGSLIWRLRCLSGWPRSPRLICVQRFCGPRRLRRLVSWTRRLRFCAGLSGTMAAHRRFTRLWG